jgi:gluconate 2-dehydrogenase gamma chain
VEANATAWLQWVLSDPSLPPQTRNFFRQGVVQLMALTASEGSEPFHRLGPETRELLLRRYEKQGGGRWLREVIHYILEALLSDPVYGGNPGGIGWRWLEHQPGFRRPGPQQRYYLLADR